MRRFVKLKALALLLLMAVATLSILPSFAQIAKFELPAWITLEAPGRPPVTLAIEGARAESTAPAAFAPDWLVR